MASSLRSQSNALVVRQKKQKYDDADFNLVNFYSM